MVRKVTETPQVTPNEFQEDLAADGLVIHHSTVQCALRREMMDRWVMQKKPFLKSNHKQSRLEYA